jgi:tetratricopeptide (TPR) repeat protein
MGDGNMASFSSVVDAVECAKDIQQSLNMEPDLKVRIGIHLGEVTLKDNDIFGNGVNIASRIQDLAGPGQILISESVYRNIKNRDNLHTVFVGKEILKGVEEPISVYEVSSIESQIPKNETAGFQRKKGIVQNRRRIILAATTIISIVIIGWWYSQSTFRYNSYTLGDSRIAVLPYENKTNNKDMDVLGDMAADWIINGLMSLDGIRVVSNENIHDHIQLASLGDLGTFGAKTGADKLLKGSFYADGDVLIFQSQLIDISTGEIDIVLPEVTGSNNNVEEIVKDLKERLLTLLATEGIVSNPSIKQTPPKYEAYEYYLMGRELHGEDYSRSREMFNRAISLDSTFYLPYGQIIAGYYNEGDSDQADSVFRIVDSRLSSLSPYDRLAHEVQRALIYGDLMDMYQAGRRLVDKDPRHFEATYEFGFFASWLNKPAEVVELYSQFEPGDVSYNIPADGWWNNVYAYNLMRLEQFSEAVKVLEVVPPELSDSWHYYTLITAYILNGNHDSLTQLFAELDNKGFSWLSVTYMHMYKVGFYSMQQDKSQFQEWSSQLMDRVYDGQSSLRVRADANFLIGNYGKAIDLFEKAVLSVDLTWRQQARMGSAYANLGLKEKALKIAKQIQADSTSGGRHKYVMGQIYAAMNEKDTAIALLKESFREGYGFEWGRYDQDPLLYSLHGYPDFEEFVRPKR